MHLYSILSEFEELSYARSVKPFPTFLGDTCYFSSLTQNVPEI